MFKQLVSKLFYSKGGVDTAVSETDRLPVADDYLGGQILDDQTGDNTVKTFTFSQPVAGFWVAVVGESGVVKINHYGGNPSPTSGIPVEAGGVLPIPEPATAVKIYIPAGLVVTVWGHTRSA